jgi:hypothetical protein
MGRGSVTGVAAALACLVGAHPVATATPVALDDEADTIDISGWRSKMVVFTDGKGHYLAVHPVYLKSGNDYENERFWYGDGKTFWLLRDGYTDRKDDGTFTQSFDDNRMERRSRVDYLKNKLQVHCDDRVTDFTPVTPDEQKTMLETGVYHGLFFRRSPYALARDDRGTYYYVDGIVSDGKWKDWRVFVGKKGKMKLAKLKNIVNDSEGDIFSTKNGELRLVVGPRGGGETRWAKGKRSRGELLTRLDIGDNLLLVYVHLGVYLNDRFNVPCDDM